MEKTERNIFDIFGGEQAVSMRLCKELSSILSEKSNVAFNLLRGGEDLNVLSALVKEDYSQIDGIGRVYSIFKRVEGFEGVPNFSKILGKPKYSNSIEKIYWEEKYKTEPMFSTGSGVDFNLYLNLITRGNLERKLLDTKNKLRNVN
jgi:hypothetical protein